MTENWGKIQWKWDLVRVSGGVRVIRVRVTYRGSTVCDLKETKEDHRQTDGNEYIVDKACPTRLFIALDICLSIKYFYKNIPSFVKLGGFKNVDDRI